MVRSDRTYYPCPCCGYFTFPVPEREAIAFICPVCYWENDVFIHSPDEPSEENHGLTLTQGKENYQAFGACDRAMLPHVRPPHKSEEPEPQEC